MQCRIIRGCATLPIIDEVIMGKAISLDVQVQTLWAARKQNGVEGLALLHKCIERTAKHRDWDALSRFVMSARRHGQGARVGAIIREAFGDKLSFKANAKHPTGGTFVLGWQGEFDLRGSNTYGVIRDAVAKGVSWDDKELGKVLTKAPKAERKVTDEAKTKVVKHLKTYADKLRADGFNVGEIIAMLQKELAAEVVTSAPVQKSVVNGVTVFEPEF
jgi:hypothetical protein